MFTYDQHAYSTKHIETDYMLNVHEQACTTFPQSFSSRIAVCVPQWRGVKKKYAEKMSFAKISGANLHKNCSSAQKKNTWYDSRRTAPHCQCWGIRTTSYLAFCFIIQYTIYSLRENGKAKYLIAARHILFLNRDVSVCILFVWQSYLRLRMSLGLGTALTELESGCVLFL